MRSEPARRFSSRLHRQTGVALWRQIADRISDSVVPAAGGSGARLPSEQQLATQFGVNRHTVRAAISALVREGVLRAEQGRGTFVDRPRRINYPISRRTRFSTGMDGQADAASSELLASRLEEASAEVAAALGLPDGAPVICLEILGRADGVAISLATSWFDAGRFAGIAESLAMTRSTTAALAAHGVEDYVRNNTMVEARHATQEDEARLDLSPGAIVLQTRYLNSDSNGVPVQYALTRFPADRVSLQLDTGDLP